jgi:hypothetical protein
MSANASGARYSFTPRLPTPSPLEVLIYTTRILTDFPREVSLREEPGPERGRYRLDIRFELLSQSGITVYRRDTPLRNS